MFGKLSGLSSKFCNKFICGCHYVVETVDVRLSEIKIEVKKTEKKRETNRQERKKKKKENKKKNNKNKKKIT